MISPELADHKAICYASIWRALPDAPRPERPHHYVMLSAAEVAELASTGSFGLPIDVIPESVRAYRAAQEGVIEAIEGEDQPAEGGVLDAIEKVVARV